MIIVARTVFYENNRYYPQVFIYEYLYKKILEYDEIKMSEDIGVNKPMLPNNITDARLYYLPLLVLS